MIVSDIEDALGFLAEWQGVALPAVRRRPLAGAPSALEPLEAANNVLGQHVLTLQDEIYLRPRPDEDGIAWLVRENQGVWIIGYRLDAPNVPLVTGDWPGPVGDHFNPYAWNTIGMTTEDALIQAVLTNGWFGLSDAFAREEGEPDVLPLETNVPIWSHPVGSVAFWTDATRSRFYFDAVWTTLCREVPCRR